MASSIYFNGRRINIPQAVSQIDASALAGVSPAAIGIVALVGTGEGGKPKTVDSTYSDHTRSETVLETYRSGNLRTAGQFVFQPSADPAVPGGAQRLIALKVNPSTQSLATLQDANALNSIDFTSKDYGLFTTQVNLEVSTGTLNGKKIIVNFETDTETFDNVGGTGVMSLLYTPSTEGYGTALATLNSSTLTVLATKAKTGLSAQRTANIGANGTVRVASTNAADTTQTMIVYGLNASNAAVQETIAMNGTTNVDGVQVFSKVLGSKLSATALGTVTVKDSLTGLTTIMSHATTVNTRGIVVLTNCPAAGVLRVSIDTNAAVDVAVFGLNASGAAAGERFDMTTGTTPVVGTTSFSKNQIIALGDVAGARTVTISCNAAQTSHASQKTIQKAVDKLNALDGFTAAALVGDSTTYQIADLDYFASQSVLSATYSMTGTIKAIVDVLVAQSQFVSAARASGALLPPANTTSAVYLAGGVEGTPSITDWSDCFTELKKRRVNIIVPLTNDPAVHSLLVSHCVERAGKLRSEANGYVGIGTNGGAGETKSNVKSQIQAINTRHVSAIAQEISRYDPDTGEATFYPPWMTGVIAAGMQAGSAIAEPLTRKVPIAIDIRNDNSWSVIDDAEEMVDAGLMMLEKVDGLGIRWIRSITTHLADDNVVFTEMSANEAANTCVFNLRRTLEIKVGQRGLAGSAAAIKGLAAGALGAMVQEGYIVAWKSLQVEQIGDVFPVSVEVAPVLPINFIPITVHLVAVRVAA